MEVAVKSTSEANKQIMKIRASVIAVGLAAGLATSQAAVLVSLGGGAQSLGSASGFATGGVEWTVPATATIAGLVVPAVSDAWVATGNTIVAALSPAGGGGGLGWAAAVGLPPLVADNSTQYYLVFGTGGSVGGPVTGGGGMSSVVGSTETFVLVPEPGTYALLAGLGLVGFASYRRFSR